MIAQLRNWHWSRWLRAILALVFLAQAVFGNDALAFAPAAFFGAQALFNLGCGMHGCNTIQSTGPVAGPEIEFKEVTSTPNADTTTTSASLRAS